MTITPADIAVQQFPVVFRGYKVEAVDAFLDRLQADLAGAPTGTAEPGASAPRPPAEDPWPAGDGAPAPEPDVATPRRAGEESAGETGSAARALRTLARAEQMAEQVLAEAAAEADAVRAGARVEAGDVLAAARAECSRLEAELDLRRQREIGALAIQAQQLRTEIARLGGLERQYRQALQALLVEQQQLLDQRPLLVDADTPGGWTPPAPDLRPAA